MMMHRMVDMIDVIRLILMANWISFEARLLMSARGVVWVTTQTSSDRINPASSTLKHRVMIFNLDGIGCLTSVDISLFLRLILWVWVRDEPVFLKNHLSILRGAEINEPLSRGLVR